MILRTFLYITSGVLFLQFIGWTLIDLSGTAFMSWGSNSPLKNLWNVVTALTNSFYILAPALLCLLGGHVADVVQTMKNKVKNDQPTS